MKGFWERWFRRRDVEYPDSATPGMNRDRPESFEDRQTDELVEEHLGGINPERLLPDEEPPPDD